MKPRALFCVFGFVRFPSVFISKSLAVLSFLLFSYASAMRYLFMHH